MIDVIFFIFQQFYSVWIIELLIIVTVVGVTLSKLEAICEDTREGLAFVSYFPLFFLSFFCLIGGVMFGLYDDYTNVYMCSGVGVPNELKEVNVVEKNKPQAVKDQEGKTKEEKLWEFACKEMPGVQKTYIEIGEALRIQRERIAKLSTTLERFSSTPYYEDSDYQQLESQCQEMEALQKSIIENIRETYIAAVKYEASMGKSQERSLHQQAFENGIREAELATRRFEEMKRHK